MGRWVPAPDTIYRILIDRSLNTFNIKITNDPICYGDPGGRNCTCSFGTDDYFFSIKMPQLFGHPISPAFQEFDSWMRSGRFWTRKTGVLLVGRLADKNVGRLEWIKPTALAHGFGLSVSSSQIDHAIKTLQAATADAGWSSPELQHDGSFRLVETTATDPRAVRVYKIFETSTFKIVAGEASNPIALPFFGYPRGYRSDFSVLAIRNMSDRQRLEVLIYEFDLKGDSSYDFRIAC